MIKENFKRFAFSSFIVSLILLIILVLITLKDSNTITDFRHNLPDTFFCLMICLVFVIPIFSTVVMLFLLVDSEIIQTKLHLMANRVSAQIAAKNADVIQTYLKSFFFEVLKRNKDLISIPIGQDLSTVAYDGFNVRYGGVFYRFGIICPEKPIYDVATLKHLVQSCIDNELDSYGIFGLSAIYRSKTVQCYSVYIDRIFYDEGNDALIFDILYVCTENSANYYQKAVQRDKKTIKPEQVVYDDEI